MRGFSTNTPKLVENKFVLEEPTAELLDDWDQREVESVLEFHEGVELPNKTCCKLVYISPFIKSTIRGRSSIMRSSKGGRGVSQKITFDHKGSRAGQGKDHLIMITQD